MNEAEKKLLRQHHPVTVPFQFIGWHLHRHYKLHPVIGKYGSALGIGLSGAYMATHPIHAIPHFLWDFFAYGIHGLGVAPFVEGALHWFQQLERKMIEHPTHHADETKVDPQ